MGSILIELRGGENEIQTASELMLPKYLSGNRPLPNVKGAYQLIKAVKGDCTCIETSSILHSGAETKSTVDKNRS